MADSDKDNNNVILEDPGVGRGGQQAPGPALGGTMTWRRELNGGGCRDAGSGCQQDVPGGYGGRRVRFDPDALATATPDPHRKGQNR